MMTRKEFWEWMKTCPIQQVDKPDGFNDEFYQCGWLNSGWFVADDEGDSVRIFFWFDEEIEDE